MKAKLILENGLIFEGKGFGHLEDTVGEVVFNTAMTGYGEILTDPSYYGEIVVMTYPLIGNYGINFDDYESKKCHLKALVVKERCEIPNNFRCELDIDTYLKNQKVIGIEGIDTRALTKIIRENGSMKGYIALSEVAESEIKEKLKGFCNKDAIKKVSVNEIITVSNGNGHHIGIWDFGVKENIVREFAARGHKVTKLPYDITAKEVEKLGLDLLFLSNGPGDPKDLSSVITNIKGLVGKIPIGGICLGHQLLALTFDGSTEKLKYGHRGGNHPVKDMQENKIYITSQNHGYHVDIVPKDMAITHVNLNDNTVEGMRHKNLPIYSVQFHPEACPGPKENTYIFDKFIELIA